MPESFFAVLERAHIFSCMLAYYVWWHMREAWRELLFADEDLDAKTGSGRCRSTLTGGALENHRADSRRRLPAESERVFDVQARRIVALKDLMKELVSRNGGLLDLGGKR
jgi:hypothetical protein